MEESSALDPRVQWLSLTYLKLKKFDLSSKRGDPTIDLKFMDKLGGYEYWKSPFFHLDDPGSEYRFFCTTNERVATTLSLILNTCIILVFFRVLGLKRLPSMMLVNKAVANIFLALAVISHTSVAEYMYLGHNSYVCRVNAQFSEHTSHLNQNVLSCAVIERLLAHQVPLFYIRGHHIFGPTLLLAPWIYWFIHIIPILIGNFNWKDFGYDCTTHSNRIGISTLGAQGSAILYISYAAVVVLFIFMVLMWKKDSGDLVEINLERFEQKTTYFILKLFFLHFFFMMLMWIIPYPGKSGMMEYEKRHISVVQVKIYDGCLLFLLLLTRQEFRNGLPKVFNSRSSIKRNRIQNLLVKDKHRTQADVTETILRQSLRSSYDSNSIIDPEQETKKPKPKLLPAQRELAMVGRDEVESTDVPEWLQSIENS